MKRISIKSKIRNVLRIMIGGIFGIILLLGIVTVFVFHNYVNKMNLASAGERKNMALETYSTEKLPSTGELEDGTKQAENTLSEKGLKEETFDTTDTDQNGNSTEIKSFQVSPNNSQQENIIEGNENSEAVETEQQWSSEMDVASLEALIKKNMETKQDLMKDKQVQNILLIGSDTRNSEKEGRADSIILLSINDKKKSIVATSFLRDIYLLIPGKGFNRLNAAYAFGGADLLLDTIEQNFKIKIDQYVMVDFYSFVDIIDALGGISVKVEEEELGSINEVIKEENKLLKKGERLSLLKKAGIYKINGEQALAFSRNRSTKNGDFDRTSRQRRVMEAILIKVKQQSFFELNNLLNLILPMVTTDFTEGEILMQLLCIPSYADYDQKQWSIPKMGTYSNIDVSGKAMLSVDFETNRKELEKQLYKKE